jgi:hypothetical protein
MAEERVKEEEEERRGKANQWAFHSASFLSSLNTYCQSRQPVEADPTAAVSHFGLDFFASLRPRNPC